MRSPRASVQTVARRRPRGPRPPGIAWGTLGVGGGGIEQRGGTSAGGLRMPLAVTVAPGTFLAIVACSAIAATIAAAAAARGLALPVVVVELLLGIAIGPQALGLQAGEFVSFFSDLGLGLLFFFAGYEIDLKRIAGTPLGLGARRMGDVARDRLRPGRRAGGGGGRAVAAVHRLGDGDHRARHAAARRCRTRASCARASGPTCSRRARWASSGRSCS